MKPHICAICKTKFDNSRDLGKHVKIVHEGEKEYKCEHCGKSFLAKFKMKRHMRDVHYEIKEFKCKLCGKSFSQKIHLNNHFKSIHCKVKNHKCDYCDKSYKLRSNMMQHIKNVHRVLNSSLETSKMKNNKKILGDTLSKQIANCKNLTIRVRKISDLETEMKNEENQKDSKINQKELNSGLEEKSGIMLCDVDIKEELENYISATQNQNEFVSNTNEKSSNQLATSSIKVEKDSLYEYKPLLEEQYNKIGHVEIKQETFDEKVVDQNGQCDPLQIDPQLINDSIPNSDKIKCEHTDNDKSQCEKTFKCEFCNKEFLQQCELKIHLYIHGGNISIKDEKCNICNNTFKGPTSLKIHKETAHYDVLKCETCGIFFYGYSSLKRHMLAIHEKRKPFECNKCSFKSSYKESLAAHFSNKHKEEGVPEHLQKKTLNTAARSLVEMPVFQRKPNLPSKFND